MKDQWSEVEYEVICQVANGVPSQVMPLNKNEDADLSVSIRSVLVELTPLEYEKDLPKDQMERCQTQHIANHVPLGWVDGVL